MGTPLNRLDFNLALGNSTTVKQWFCTEENGEHLVCMRLQKAIPRGRYINMLRGIETRNGTNLKPVPGATWADTVFMGDEIRNGGGRAIRDTLIRHMQSGNRAYRESIAAFTQHTTHMLRDPLRSSRTDDAPQEEEESPAGPALLSRENSLATLPVQSPRPQESSSARVDAVRSNIALASTVADIMRDFYNIPPGYDIRGTLDQINERVLSLQQH